MNYLILVGFFAFETMPNTARYLAQPWRGDLSPLGREAAPCAYSDRLSCQGYDCCAAERGGAAFR